MTGNTAVYPVLVLLLTRRPDGGWQVWQVVYSTRERLGSIEDGRRRQVQFGTSRLAACCYGVLVPMPWLAGLVGPTRK